jgi:glycine oxidase
MTTDSDVVIIGGGVMGCATAYYLARRGISVTVFEQNTFGWGASGATAGVVGPLWHVPHDNAPFFDLALKSLSMFSVLADELTETGFEPQYRQTGVLKVALTEEHAGILRDDLRWQSDLDMGVRWLDSQEVLDREPDISSQILGGVFSPSEGYVVGQRLVDSLVHAGARLDVRFFDKTEVFGLETDGNRVVGIRVASGVVEADHVVLASGPWTGIASRWIPEDVPIRPVKGQRIVLKLPGLLPKSPVHGFGGYCVPQPDGGIMVAATRHENEFDQVPTAEGISNMIQAAVNLYPKLKDAQFESVRVGVRPGTPDDVPIVGPVSGWDGLSIISGHDAVAIMMAPATADALAESIVTGDISHLESFNLERFG